MNQKRPSRRIDESRLRFLKKRVKRGGEMVTLSILQERAQVRYDDDGSIGEEWCDVRSIGEGVTQFDGLQLQKDGVRG